MNIVKNEPALISGLVSAVIALLISFGFSLSDEQVGAIMAVVTIVLSIAVRMSVTPTNKLKDAEPIPVAEGPVPPPAQSAEPGYVQPDPEPPVQPSGPTEVYPPQEPPTV
jgi:hypothetical protein